MCPNRFKTFSKILIQMNSTSKLVTLIENLRLYKPNEDEEDDGDDGVTAAAIEITAGPVRAQPERFIPKKAAVLICLFEDEIGQIRVILTKRSSNLSTHSGEVSLPGGKMEEGDADERETALREAYEEIGLDPSLVEVVAILEPFLSKHLLRVVPVIAVLSAREAFTPIANLAEVETVFDAPLEMFLQEKNKRSEEREWMGNKYLVHYFDYETEKKKKFLIWGLTASILIRAASVIYQRPPSFPEDKPKFKIPRFVTKNLQMP